MKKPTYDPLGFKHEVIRLHIPGWQYQPFVSNSISLIIIYSTRGIKGDDGNNIDGSSARIYKCCNCYSKKSSSVNNSIIVSYVVIIIFLR